MGRPVAVPGSPTLGARGRVAGIGASGRGPGSDRGCARGLAGAPGFGAGPPPPPPGRDAASSFRRLAPGLALGLCRCTCPRAAGVVVGGGLGGESREGSAVRQRPAPGAFRVPAGAPGRPRALGLTRLGYGAGKGAGEPPGTERRPAGRPGAGGCVSPGGSGARAAAGWGREFAPRPPRPPGAQSGICQPAERGWCKAVAATSFRLAGRACPPSDARRGPSWRPAARGAREPALRGLGQPLQVERACGRSSPSPPRPAPRTHRTSLGPQVWLRAALTPYPFRGKKREGRLAAGAGRINSLPGTWRGAEVSWRRRDPWSSL